MSDTLYDGGYVGQLVSLAGVKGRDGLGARVWSSQPAPPATGAGVEVMGPNPSRLWALITNEGTVDVQLAFDNVFTNGLFTLRPGGSFMINKNLPWTGTVHARVTGGVAGTLSVAAASVQAAG